MRTARASGHPLLGMSVARFFIQVFVLKALLSVPFAVPLNGTLETPGFICALVDLAPESRCVPRRRSGRR